MPRKVFKSLEKISLEEFVERMGKLHPKKIRNRKNNWLKLIKSGKLVCPVSNKKVAYCSLDEHQKVKSRHYNFYSEDNQMFTIDHITPISKGGAKTSLNNIQPMLDYINFNKGNRTDLGY